MDPLTVPDCAGFPRVRRTTGPDETRALGRALARVAVPGQAILLHGSLGAGKTCLVQGLGEALGVTEDVISPTFTLVNRYPGRTTLDHLDFYRIEPTDDLGDIGVLDILDELEARATLLVVEWPNLLVPLLPRRIELLALPGENPDQRLWYARGVPELPAAFEPLFPEANPAC
jgi:tRNA threonylcarbamoyladenosine biosynthesis protein TsaE